MKPKRARVKFLPVFCIFKKHIHLIDMVSHTLDELSSSELTLYNSTPENLFFDELDNQLEANGTFQQYRELHHNYLEHC